MRYSFLYFILISRLEENLKLFYYRKINEKWKYVTLICPISVLIRWWQNIQLYSIITNHLTGQQSDSMTKSELWSMCCLTAVTKCDVWDEKWGWDEKWRFERKYLYTLIIFICCLIWHLALRSVLQEHSSFFFIIIALDKYFFFQAWKLNDVVGLILCLYHWNSWLKCRATNVSRILFWHLSWHGVRFTRMFGHSRISKRLPAMPAFVSYSAVPYTL